MACKSTTVGGTTAATANAPSRPLPADALPAVSPSPMQVGQRVMIDGLQASGYRRHNGMCGCLSNYDEDTGRWVVQVDGGPSVVISSRHLVDRSSSPAPAPSPGSATDRSSSPARVPSPALPGFPNVAAAPGGTAVAATRPAAMHVQAEQPAARAKRERPADEEGHAERHCKPRIRGAPLVQQEQLPAPVSSPQGR